MTIGSTHNHPADLAIEPSLSVKPWAARYPNPPDLCFDYRRLLEQEGGVAYATQPDHRICIVGAGVTGLTAARELLRCGFTRITLIEQSRRVGGRHLTMVNNAGNHKQPVTPFEMGPCACRSSTGLVSPQKMGVRLWPITPSCSSYEFPIFQIPGHLG